MKMVLPERIELSASPLPRECSTPELRQRFSEPVSATARQRMQVIMVEVRGKKGAWLPPFYRGTLKSRANLEIDQGADIKLVIFNIAQIAEVVAETKRLAVDFPINTKPPKEAVILVIGVGIEDIRLNVTIGIAEFHEGARLTNPQMIKPR